jgi:hypothetical protein
VELREVAMHLHERVLDDVVRLVRVGGEHERPPVHDRLQRADERGERRDVAGLGARRQLPLRDVARRDGGFDVGRRGEHGR